MRRSTFVKLGLLAFGAILGTFVIRGSTRLLIGDRLSLWLASPFALLSFALVVVLVLFAVADLSGIHPMEDDLDPET